MKYKTAFEWNPVEGGKKSLLDLYGIKLLLYPIRKNIIGSPQTSFINLENVKRIDLIDGISAKVVTAETLTVAHVTLLEGAVLPEHAHINEQVVNLIKGELELTVQGEKFVLTPGKVMVLPSNIPHSGKAIKECYVVDVFHPIREDFKNATEGNVYDKK